MNIAGRAGRWSARTGRPRPSAGWRSSWSPLVAGSPVGTQELTDAEQAQRRDRARAETILARARASSRPRPRASSCGRAPARGLRRAVSGRSPRPARSLRAAAAGRAHPRTAVSKDGRAALVTFDIAGKADTADTRVAAGARRGRRRCSARIPGFTLAEFGDASGEPAVNDAIGKDLRAPSVTSVPVTFLILLLAFGAFVAAGMPVLLAFSAVLALARARRRRQPRRPRVQHDELE